MVDNNTTYLMMRYEGPEINVPLNPWNVPPTVQLQYRRGTTSLALDYQFKTTEVFLSVTNETNKKIKVPKE